MDFQIRSRPRMDFGVRFRKTLKLTIQITTRFSDFPKSLPSTFFTLEPFSHRFENDGITVKIDIKMRISVYLSPANRVRKLQLTNPDVWHASRESG